MTSVILVAGFDYLDLGRGVDFRIFCDRRRKKLTALNTARDELMFTTFDFKRGEVVTHQVTYPNGRESSIETKETRFDPITAVNYDDQARFRDGQWQANIMSILDIYIEVQRIGARSPQSLLELSFFAHAWWGGPILVNSFDDGIVTSPDLGTITLQSGERDWDDFDPRASKDFVTPTITESDLENFRKAFRSDAYIWSWGCQDEPISRQILDNIEKNNAYRDSGLTDDTVFRLINLSRGQAELLDGIISRESGISFSNASAIDIKFGYLKYFFCKQILASYNHQLATRSGVKLYGALLGTYSSYDKGSIGLMSVPGIFAKHFTFYKNYFGFELDPEGRNYGMYKPDFNCSLSA